MVTRDLTDRFHAGKLMGKLAAMLEGRGGGRPDMAQGGGPRLDLLDQVLDQDPEGQFIHRWCPELEGLTGKLLANPETAGELFPAAYPKPIVDLKETRKLALEQWGKIK